MKHKNDILHNICFLYNKSYWGLGLSSSKTWQKHHKNNTYN